MAKKSGRKKTGFRQTQEAFNSNYLLGSSADTVNPETMNQNNNHGTIHLGKHLGQQHHELSHPNSIDIVGTQAYNYALLNDDIAEEAALLSSSEGGYEAELDDDRFDPSLNSSAASQNMNIELESEYVSNGIHDRSPDSPGYNSSVFSEVSDSVLLLEERDSYTRLKWHKRPSVLMISVMVFLYAYSLGIAMSAELKLVMQGVCYVVTDHTMENCSSTIVQQKNADLQKWSNFIPGFLRIVVSVQMGKLSDIYGRKPIILFAFTLCAVGKLMEIFLLTPEYFSFLGVIFFNSVEALGGSMFVLLGLANSYTIDVVHEKERLPALGKVTGALFLGLSLGPLSSSFLSSTFSIHSIYFIGISAMLLIISTIVIIIFIPESRSSKLREKSRRFSIRSQRESMKNKSVLDKLGLSTLVTSFKSLKLLWISRPKNFNPQNPENNEIDETSQLLSTGTPSSAIDMTARINSLMLLCIEILLTFCSAGASLPVALYLIYMFDLSQSQLGLFVGVAAGSRAIILTIFNPWMQHKLLQIFIHDSVNVDFIDITSVGLAIVCELIASLLCSCSSSVIVIGFYVLLSSMSSIGSPVLHSALLKYNFSQGKNGEFFGALALIRNLINLLSPWVFLSVYSFGVGIGRPEIIFYIIFVLFSIAAILLGNLKMKSVFS